MARMRREVEYKTRNIDYFFFIFHVFCLLVVGSYIGLSVLALTQENHDLKDLNLNITRGICYVFISCSIGLFLLIILGIFAYYKKKKAYLWILYCLLLSMLSITQIGASATAISKYIDHEDVEIKLKAFIEGYLPVSKEVNATKVAWDNVQIKFSCCGVRDYKDWKEVEYGRTSLQVPQSCCLPHLRIDEDCGQNLLPDHPDPSSLINPEGCLIPIVKELEEVLLILGVFGLAVTFCQCLVVALSCFLVITRRL